MSFCDRRKYFSAPADELRRNIPRWDCHIHTCYGDGVSTIEEVVHRAISIGLERIVFTEHTEPWLLSRRNWFERYVADIRAAKERYTGQIEIFIGLEAPATDFGNKLGLIPEMLESADFIVGSAHRYPGLKGRKVMDLSPEESIEMEYKTLMALSENPFIDAIGHIGGTCQKYHQVSLATKEMREVIKTATGHGIAIEINLQYHQPFSLIINLCIEEGARITLGSDAHKAGEVGAIVAALSLFEGFRVSASPTF